MNINECDIQAGQAAYTSFLLKIYNIWVLDISNRWIWRCPKSYQLQQFNKNITANHLDIGVGTGYYLQHCRWPSNLKLALMDLNPNCLEYAKKAVAILVPTIYLHDIFKPKHDLKDQFNSISMNYLLHCLPGNMKTKTLVIENAVAMLKSSGVLFGATILSDQKFHTIVSQQLLNFYNKKKIFSNKQDNYQSLQNLLKNYLNDVELQVIGCVALFKGYKKS